MKREKVFKGHFHFPEEILTEVLTKLPVKSLLRFRCVSKIWCNIIDNPDFISKHMIHYNSTNNNHIHENYPQISTFQLKGDQELNFTTLCSDDTFMKLAPLINIPVQYRPRASVDGLILLVAYYPNFHLRLWNPSTRKSLLLPLCGLIHSFGYSFALGFSTSSNDHKVFAFDFDSIAKDGRILEVYGLSDGCWCRSSKGMDVSNRSRLRMNYHCLSTKGAAYWLATDLDHEMVSWGSYTDIVSFDYNAEEFSIVKLPQRGVRTWFMFILGDSFAVLGISLASTCIWVMDMDGGKTWTKWYSRDSSSEVYTFFINWHPYGDGTILYVKKCSLFLMVFDGKLMSYNIRSNEIRPLAKSVGSLLCIYTHVETLLLHKGLEAQALTSFL